MSILNFRPYISQSIANISLTLILGTAFSLLSSPLYAATIGENLIVNGDAEQGKGDPIGNAVGSDIPTIPGWNPSGIFSVLQYGATGFDFVNLKGQTVRVDGLPSATSPGPIDRGQNFFYGGGDRASSSAEQFIDVTNLASTIDSGKDSFTLSGWLGGYEKDQDSASLDVTFLSSNKQSLGKASIESPTPSQRNNITGLFLQSADGLVPIGTRQIDVVLNMNYSAGRVNDAYADDLSLVIEKVPEPSTSWTSLIGISFLLVYRLRQNRRIVD